MGILPDAYISKHEVFKVDVQLLPPAVCLQYKIFKIFCVYTMVQRPNILPPQISHLVPGVSGVSGQYPVVFATYHGSPQSFALRCKKL